MDTSNFYIIPGLKSRRMLSVYMYAAHEANRCVMSLLPTPSSSVYVQSLVESLTTQMIKWLVEEMSFNLNFCALLNFFHSDRSDERVDSRAIWREF